MTKRKKDHPGEKLSPLDEEMAESYSPHDQPQPEASVDEVAAASIFAQEAGPASADGEAPPAPADRASSRPAPGSGHPAGDPGGEAAEPPAVARADLQTELERLRAKSDEYLDGWQRSRAEFANYKKRIEREQEEARSRAAAAVLTKILPAIDDLERALRDRPDGEEARAWTEGIELIHRKLAGLLESEGVEVIPAADAQFDPALHEAVTHEPSEAHEHGQVIEVIQQGYRLGDRVLRPARVRVAK